jgi:hypothetical protein
MATTQKQISIKGVEGVQDQAPTNNDFIIVWSALRHPLTLTFPTHRYNNQKTQGARHETITYTLKPGANRVPKNIWDHNAKKETIVKRLDNRDLIAGSATKPKDMERKLKAIEVGEPPQKAASIGDLCPAADDVSMRKSMKEAGTLPTVHDLDSDPQAITLEP